MNPQSLKNIFLKFNTIIFIVIIASGLIFCVILVNQALSQTAGTETNIGSIDPNQTKFDAITKSKLSSLKPSANNQANVQLPPGRINPFWDFTE
jgi:hypothetical protein